MSRHWDNVSTIQSITIPFTTTAAIDDWTVFFWYKPITAVTNWIYWFEGAHGLSDFLHDSGNNSFIHRATNGNLTLLLDTDARNIWRGVFLHSSPGDWQRRLIAGSVGNGVREVDGTGNSISTSVANFVLGRGSSAADPARDMKVAHLAVWSRKLDNTERDSLLAGANPEALSAVGRVLYLPLTDAGLTNRWSPPAGITIGAASVSGTIGVDTGDNPTVDAPPSSAATLSSPTSASVTQTGATIGATTDDNAGTLYGVVTTSASAPSATQIKAGQDHTGSAAAGSGSNASLSVGANTIAITGLTAATSYYYYLVQDNGADSNVVNGTFTTSVAAPTLTSPTAVSIGTTTVTPRVTTDTGNGTCYYVITPQAESEPSNTQVEAGTNAADGSPVASGSQVVSASGVITFSEVTGLTAGTAYRISYAHSGTPS